MKKMLGLMLAMASVTATSAHAAGELDLRPYAGIEYQLSTNLGKNINKEVGQPVAKDDSSTIGLVAGLQLTEFVGVEASMSHSLENIASGSSGNTKVTIATLGLTGQYPLTDYVYAKGSVGAAVGRLDTKNSSGATFKNSDVEFIGKFGLGYIIDDLNVLELTYVYGLGSDGVGLLYKHYFN